MSSECEGARVCIEEFSPHLQVPCEGMSCSCFPKLRKECKNTAECEEIREVCTFLPEKIELMPGLDSPICMSAVITGFRPDMKEVLGGPKREKQSPSHGLTLFTCMRNEDCKGERSCIFQESPGKPPVPCEPGMGCFCFPVDSPPLCKYMTECEPGEICARVPPSPPICVAADAESAFRQVSALGEDANQSILGSSDTDMPGTNGGGRNGPRRKDGVTGDSCNLSKDCEEGRICVQASSPLESIPCGDGSECLCFPGTGPNVCADDEDCENNREICASEMPRFPDAVCISSVLVAFNDELKPVSENSKAGRSPGSGFTLYPCIFDEECLGDRTCVLGDTSTSCQSGLDCFCFPEDPKFCSESQQCESREVCATLNGMQMCVSEDVEATFQEISGVPDNGQPESSTESADSDSDMNPSDQPPPSPEGEPGDEQGSTEEGHGSIEPEESTESETAEASIEANPTAPSAAPSSTPAASGGSTCIDANALMHMDPADLVFASHSWSNVLCDSNGSCATKGHMVTFKGKAMMMDTYCGLATCIERVMQVNSPKYRRGLRVDSKTEGLQYTAFAARYETNAEEAVMAAAVRVGL